MDIAALVDSYPNFHAYAVMIIIVVALFLFASDRIPLPTSALMIMVILALLFEIFPYRSSEGSFNSVRLFSGFGHQALVAVCALMIAGQALVQTGALEPIGRQLARYWGDYPTLTFLMTMVIGALLSAFLNNTPIVILILPVLISVSLKTGSPASGLLMPVGLATSLGGMATTIGTSTNLLVVSVAQDLGTDEIGMFDFALPAAIAGSIGILYLAFVAPKLLPIREGLMQNSTPRLFNAQLRVHDNSSIHQKTLSDAIALSGGLLEVKNILRGEKNNRLIALPDRILKSGDRIAVRSSPEQLKELEDTLGVSLFSGEEAVDERHRLQDATQQRAEVVIVPGSTLDGQTLSNVRFRERYALMVLALFRTNRREESQGLGHTEYIKLSSGDILLVQGSANNVERLKSSRNLLVLDAKSDLPISSRALIAMLIMVMIVATVATGLLPISISAVCGVVLMLLTGCLKWRDATQALSASVIMIIATSLAMGKAMVETGGAEIIASAYIDVAQGLSPMLLLGVLMAMIAVLTNVVSNNAAAVIGTPIAISIAHQLGLSTEPFVLAVIFGANMSFATPMAYQTNLLVMNAGNYTFGDFIRVGLPLVVIMLVSLTLILPWLYDL